MCVCEVYMYYVSVYVFESACFSAHVLYYSFFAQVHKRNVYTCIHLLFARSIIQMEMWQLEQVN